jgi:hypothetical protein
MAGHYVPTLTTRQPRVEIVKKFKSAGPARRGYSDDDPSSDRTTGAPAR